MVHAHLKKAILLHKMANVQFVLLLAVHQVFFIVFVGEEFV